MGREAIRRDDERRCSKCRANTPACEQNDCISTLYAILFRTLPQVVAHAFSEMTDFSDASGNGLLAYFQVIDFVPFQAGKFLPDRAMDCPPRVFHAAAIA